MFTPSYDGVDFLLNYFLFSFYHLKKSCQGLKVDKKWISCEKIKSTEN